MVPLLTKIGTDILQQWAAIERCQFALQKSEKTQNRFNNNELGTKIQKVKDLLNNHIDKINDYLHEIEVLGCTVSCLTKGIILIPSLLNGRKIFLCYRSGEDSVGYWHELGEVYDSRKKIIVGQNFYWRR